MATDRFKYFRVEARELLEGLSAGVLALEQGAPAGPGLAALLRHAHTLKGAARIVGLPEVADLAHALEDRLEALRAGAAIDAGAIDALLRLVDALAAAIAGMDGPRPARAERPPEEAFDTVRVDLAEMDALLESIAESGVGLRALRHDLAALTAARERVAALPVPPSARPAAEAAAGAIAAAVRDLAARIDRVETELTESRARADRLRLVPAEAVFGPLQRACRDAAHGLGRRVAWSATGGDTRLDGHVLGGLRDALLHAVRNAVDHGIEPGPERAVAGKPAEGRLALHVERRGARVAFTLTDDGRGVDVARVREAAVARGLLDADAAAALGDEAALALLFRPGFSTAGAVTAISGRGVGLDVVRAVVDGLKGEVALRSRPGAGIALTLTVPLSLSAMAALLVEAGGQTLGLPLDAVRRTLHVPDAAIVPAAAGRAVTFEGEVLPFVALADLLPDPPPPRPGRGGWSVMILDAGGRRAAVGVTRLIGTTDLVVRRLPRAVGDLPLLIGASFDAEGVPQPVLDPRGVVAVAHAPGGAGRTAHAGPAGSPVGGPVGVAAPGPARPRVLVIDDSVSTRMMAQAILEAAGYDVDQAADGEAGLARAQAGGYGLFLVDADMPVLDGFGFLARARADATLARVPAIMLTSRSSEADRRRALAAGARGYMVKSEFRPEAFLALVGELLA